VKYVLDTCVFNWLLSERIELSHLPSDGEFVATHVQRDELDRTPCETRRANLLGCFTEVVDEHVFTESAVVGVSKVGLCKLSDGQLYSSIRHALDSLNKSKPNNASDALIAEVAIVNGWTLITADRDLAKVAVKHEALVHLLRA